MDFTDETIPMPRIGDQAPVFDAVTTQGKIHFPLDFNGKWIILFSHPSDFTPVCTSEFVTFGAMTEEFKALNCQLIGLSVDGLYSHIAWLRTIREKIEYKGKKNVEVQFPLIADVTMEVAHLYGMIQPRESCPCRILHRSARNHPGHYLLSAGSGTKFRRTETGTYRLANHR